MGWVSGSKDSGGADFGGLDMAERDGWVASWPKRCGVAAVVAALAKAGVFVRLARCALSLLLGGYRRAGGAVHSARCGHETRLVSRLLARLAVV